MPHYVVTITAVGDPGGHVKGGRETPPVGLSEGQDGPQVEQFGGSWVPPGLQRASDGEDAWTGVADFPSDAEAQEYERALERADPPLRVTVVPAGGRRPRGPATPGPRPGEH